MLQHNLVVVATAGAVSQSACRSVRVIFSLLLLVLTHPSMPMMLLPLQAPFHDGREDSKHFVIRGEARVSVSMSTARLYRGGSTAAVPVRFQETSLRHCRLFGEQISSFTQRFSPQPHPPHSMGQDQTLTPLQWMT